MQSIIVFAVLIIFSFYAIIQTKRDRSLGNYPMFKADRVAGNIFLYSDKVTKYVLANYDDLHVTRLNNTGIVEGIQELENKQFIDNNTFNPLLNYQVVSFNYALAGSESQVFPILFVAISFDNYAVGIVPYSLSNIPEILGIVNQMLSRHIYQGNSTYWTVPWLLQQDGQCNAINIFSQLPDTIDGDAQLNQLKTLFNILCRQIQNTNSYKFLTYVYIAPVVVSHY